ncbi:MAG: adenosylcobalamin-dependent ribonucleoside-diphosphate reductase [Alicyclobacillaceae bacterium]|nr:adenosylcobalamin-dependent ribonucleoside-diphosphate reductase [Alicyclobacillaceae bacterium]
MNTKMNGSMLSFTEEDALHATGERIVADRYLMKDVQKETLTNGSLVVAVLDKKRAYHELARVVEIHTGGQQVTVELRDGTREVLPIQQVDVLLETSPRQMWRRIARGAAAVTEQPEAMEEAFYQLQSRWRYVPGGRINASMGSGMKTTSYNCFVIPSVGPTMRDYAQSFGQTLEIQARSGGVGMNLTRIPPQGSIVPVDTRDRRSHLHLTLDVWHSDVRDFIQATYPHSTKVVRLSKDFLRAVEEHTDWTFRFPDTTVPNYDELWNGRLEDWLAAGLPVVEQETVPARDLYDELVASGVALWTDVVGTILYPGDQRGTIAATLGDMWESMKEGRRVTVMLSSLRPRYSYVRGVNGRSSGAYSWGQLFDKGNEVYGTGFGPVGVGEIMSVGCQLTLQGGSRRGALMLILNDQHADILKFIRCKQVDGVITGANISVGISERFMEAKEAGSTWTIGYVPLDAAQAFDGDFEAWEAKGGLLETATTMPAGDLWNELCESAWKSAEPGVVFLGRANRLSNSYYFNPLVATNPCGEQPLPANGICNLGAVVLSKFAVGFRNTDRRQDFADKQKEEYVRKLLEAHFNPDEADFLLHHVLWEELEWVTRTGLRFQDAVIDATYYPFEENRQNQLRERRVGLGIMGLHDLLLYCGYRYGSKDSVQLIDVLLGLMAEWCYLESVELAKVHGPFPAFDAELFLKSGYMQQMGVEKPHVVQAIREYGVRNVTTMTIAPTGTTGTMVGCSTGCEPYYAWTYYRNSRLGMFEESAEIVQEYQESNGSTTLPEYFVTAMDLSPEDHVRVQGALQRWIDSSISKTCNAPNSYTVEDTKQLYQLAYEVGCKGVTIYRDGSRSEQVLSLKSEDTADDTADLKPIESAEEVAVAGAPQYKKRKRPDVLYGATYRKTTPLGKAFITINDDANEHVAVEMFVNIGKAGTDVYAANEALGRAITLYLRDSMNPNKEAELVKHFSGIGGSNSVGFGNNRITSVPDAIAKSLIQHAETFPLRQLGDDSLSVHEETAALDGVSRTNLRHYTVAKDWCPECHQHTLVHTGGCYECEACGFSKC